LRAGCDVLFDIDWQGAQQVRKSLGADVVSVFILPPSMEELRMRLDRRAEDSSATIAARLDNARKEIERELDCHVHLDLSVRVRRDWRADEALLDRLGLT